MDYSYKSLIVGKTKKPAVISQTFKLSNLFTCTCCRALIVPSGLFAFTEHPRQLDRDLGCHEHNSQRLCAKSLHIIFACGSLQQFGFCCYNCCRLTHRLYTRTRQNQKLGHIDQLLSFAIRQQQLQHRRQDLSIVKINKRRELG